ncbi:MAG: hypothetical protein RLZ12_801 [Bacillota bacterium]|jgi:hypothetical protein
MTFTYEQINRNILTNNKSQLEWTLFYNPPLAWKNNCRDHYPPQPSTYKYLMTAEELKEDCQRSLEHLCPAGAPGPQGPQGPQGPAGGGSGSGSNILSGSTDGTTGVITLSPAMTHGGLLTLTTTSGSPISNVTGITLTGGTVSPAPSINQTFPVSQGNPMSFNINVSLSVSQITITPTAQSYDYVLIYK